MSLSGEVVFEAIKWATSRGLAVLLAFPLLALLTPDSVMGDAAGALRDAYRPHLLIAFALGVCIGLSRLASWWWTGRGERAEAKEQEELKAEVRTVLASLDTRTRSAVIWAIEDGKLHEQGDVDLDTLHRNGFIEPATGRWRDTEWVLRRDVLRALRQIQKEDFKTERRKA